MKYCVLVGGRGNVPAVRGGCHHVASLQKPKTSCFGLLPFRQPSLLSITNPACLCSSIFQVHFADSKYNGSSLGSVSKPLPASSQFPGELHLSKALWLQASVARA